MFFIGLELALRSSREGSHFLCTVSSRFGYGEEGRNRMSEDERELPPNSYLRYEVFSLFLCVWRSNLQCQWSLFSYDLGQDIFYCDPSSPLLLGARADDGRYGGFEMIHLMRVRVNCLEWVKNRRGRGLETSISRVGAIRKQASHILKSCKPSTNPNPLLSCLNFPEWKKSGEQSTMSSIVDRMSFIG